MGADVVAAMFENQAAAQQAEAALVGAGISPSVIDVVSQPVRSTGVDQAEHSRGVWNQVRAGFMPHPHEHGFAEGVERGHVVLFVRAAADQQVTAIEVLEGQNPLDVMRRVEQWREAGWSGLHRSQKAETLPQMHFSGADPEHQRATGLINEHDAAQGVGARLVNPMGIAVPGVTWSGSSRVRRYAAD